MPNHTLREIVDLLMSRKKEIIRFCGIVGLGAIIISLLLPNKFKATTVFYAASDDLSRPEVMFGTTSERSYYYGGGDERDRLITASKSNRLFDKVMEKHDLLAHYKVKEDGNIGRQKAMKKFQKNFEVTKNDLDAIELSYIDKDPEFCATIANDTREGLNDLVSGIIKSSQQNVIKTLETKLKNAKLTIAGINDSIGIIRNQYRFYDSENQIPQISELVMASKNKLQSEKARLGAYVNMRGARRDSINNIRARINGLESQIKAIEYPDSTSINGMNIIELNRIKPQLLMLEGRYFTLRGELVKDELILERLKMIKGSRTPALHLVEPAETPTLKFSPKRSILVLGAVVAAFIFYVLGLLLIEGYKRSA